MIQCLQDERVTTMTKREQAQNNLISLAFNYNTLWIDPSGDVYHTCTVKRNKIEFIVPDTADMGVINKSCEEIINNIVDGFFTDENK